MNGRQEPMLWSLRVEPQGGSSAFRFRTPDLSLTRPAAPGGTRGVIRGE
jgi:hypothetical protein